MPMYERGAGAHVAERVRVPEGGEDEARYEELVKGGGNWRRVEEDAPAGPADDGKPKVPNRSASKADWMAYAIGEGMDEAEADKATRDELADRYHGPKG